MTYQFFICDVFTKHAFQGNQLAVLPEASGLNDEQMQQIAREFNFSETTFVFPPGQGQTKRVRIFTPTSEVPFAGHPNLGTAFTLYHNGYLGDAQPPLQVVFEDDVRPSAEALPALLREVQLLREARSSREIWPRSGRDLAEI